MVLHPTETARMVAARFAVLPLLIAGKMIERRGKESTFRLFTASSLNLPLTSNLHKECQDKNSHISP